MPFTLATSTLLQDDTQSSAFLHSRCPNHLNLPCLNTSATISIPKRPYKSSLRFLSSTTLHTSISPFIGHYRFSCILSTPYAVGEAGTQPVLAWKMDIKMMHFKFSYSFLLIQTFFQILNKWGYFYTIIFHL